jgi:hypothetical protein
MAVIKIRRPLKSAWNPNRPMSSLVKWQIEHLHQAEKRLPVQHQTGMYVNAVRTEGEAADYTRAVTEAIHRAHAEAEAQRVPSVPPKRRPVIDIAAVADEKVERKSASKAKKKKSTAKRKGTK